MRFNKGDKVRITNNGYPGQEWLAPHVGKIATVYEDRGGFFMGEETWTRWGIWNDNVELVKSSIDEQIAEAEAKLKELVAERDTQNLKQFEAAALGSFAIRRHDDGHASRYVKVAPNSWVLIGEIERNDPGKIFRNKDISQVKATVER